MPKNIDSWWVRSLDKAPLAVVAWWKKSGEAYEVWLSPDGYRSDWFVRIHKGSLVTLASKDHRGFIEWDSSNPITLIFVWDWKRQKRHQQRHAKNNWFVVGLKLSARGSCGFKISQVKWFMERTSILMDTLGIDSFESTKGTVVGPKTISFVLGIGPIQ